jgi:hypothetical protein
MQSLIIRRGLNKRAAAEDGPSFEQQFGILANALIADKFPQLDNMKLAFQLIEKNEDNSEACGATVYLIGKNIVFIPAFFKNNKLKTADMMFLAQSQQFLPLADPWLAWLKNKDLADVGELIPQELVDDNLGTKGTTIRDIADPIIKTASVYLRGLLHTEPNMMEKVTGASILDTALSFGKQASETLLDNMIKNANFLNATLTFYSGDELDSFAKKASEMSASESSVELIMPLDKEAKTLNDHELKALYKDGFFIRKTASGKSPDVIRSKQLKGMFSAVSESGKVQMLQLNGDLKECLVLNRVDLDTEGYCGELCCDYGRRDSLNASSYMKSRNGEHGLGVATEKAIASLPMGAMCMSSNKEPFKPEMLEGIGLELSASKQEAIPDGAYLLFPDGTYARWDNWGYRKTADGNGWTNRSGDKVISVASDNSGLLKPIISAASVVFPKGTRIIMPENYNDNGLRREQSEEELCRDSANPEYKAPVAFVTMNTLDAFLTEYCKKQYNKARVYHNGSEYIISGDKSEDNNPKSIKEAAMILVQDYDLDPAIAKVMLKEASNGATYDNPKSTLYYITKTALDEAQWQDANISMSQAVNMPPKVEQQQMPMIQENPEQLQQAVLTAAQAGIKEVFDVTALKLLCRQNHFFDEISDDIPLFMRVLDSLCRKLFQFYWHTDKMEEKYGLVKMKALEESLKCTLDSLSELTIFFKLRTVDGTGVTGDTVGELMSGQML